MYFRAELIGISHRAMLGPKQGLCDLRRWTPGARASTIGLVHLVLLGFYQCLWKCLVAAMGWTLFRSHDAMHVLIRITVYARESRSVLAEIDTVMQ